MVCVFSSVQNLPNGSLNQKYKVMPFDLLLDAPLLYSKDAHSFRFLSKLEKIKAVNLSLLCACRCSVHRSKEERGQLIDLVRKLSLPCRSQAGLLILKLEIDFLNIFLVRQTLKNALSLLLPFWAFNA